MWNIFLRFGRQVQSGHCVGGGKGGGGGDIGEKRAEGGGGGWKEIRWRGRGGEERRIQTWEAIELMIRVYDKSGDDGLLSYSDLVCLI